MYDNLARKVAQVMVQREDADHDRQLKEDQLTAAAELAAMEILLPWDEMEEMDPSLYKKMDEQYQDLKEQKGFENVYEEELSDYPDAVSKYEEMGDEIRRMIGI